MMTEHADDDRPWKTVIERFFQELKYRAREAELEASAKRHSARHGTLSEDAAGTSPPRGA